MSDTAAILFANDAFYAAFASGDMNQMRRVWADDCVVTCIHPGWQPLVGLDNVMESWQGILSSGETAGMRCEHARAHVLGETAYVTAFERLSGGVLAVTNVFVRRGSLWRMVHHQAGPCQDAPPAESPRDGPTLQ